MSADRLTLHHRRVTGVHHFDHPVDALSQAGQIRGTFRFKHETGACIDVFDRRFERNHHPCFVLFHHHPRATMLQSRHAHAPSVRDVHPRVSLRPSCASRPCDGHAGEVRQGSQLRRRKTSRRSHPARSIRQPRSSGKGQTCRARRRWPIIKAQGLTDDEGCITLLQPVAAGVLLVGPTDRNVKLMSSRSPKDPLVIRAGCLRGLL